MSNPTLQPIYNVKIILNLFTAFSFLIFGVPIEFVWS